MNLIIFFLSVTHANLVFAKNKFNAVESLSIATNAINFTQVTTTSNHCSSFSCGYACLKTNVCLLFFYKPQECTIITATALGTSTTVANNSYSMISSPNNYVSMYLSAEYDNNLAKFMCKLPEYGVPSSQTLLQQRLDGCLSFNRTWTEYANGFGEATGNYWIGLEQIRSLTASSPKTIRIEMKKFGDDTLYWTEYGSFQVNTGANKYQLTISGYDGTSTAGESLQSNNVYFTTIDSDNDGIGFNCASATGGGWFFTNCGISNPNGDYQYVRIFEYYRNIYWYHLDNYNSLKFIRMLFVN